MYPVLLYPEHSSQVLGEIMAENSPEGASLQQQVRSHAGKAVTRGGVLVLAYHQWNVGIEDDHLLREGGVSRESQRLGTQPWETEKEGDRDIGENMRERERERAVKRKMEKDGHTERW